MDIKLRPFDLPASKGFLILWIFCVPINETAKNVIVCGWTGHELELKIKRYRDEYDITTPRRSQHKVIPL